MRKRRKTTLLPTLPLPFWCFLFSVIFPSYPQAANLVTTRRGEAICFDRDSRRDAFRKCSVLRAASQNAASRNVDHGAPSLLGLWLLVGRWVARTEPLPPSQLV